MIRSLGNRIFQPWSKRPPSQSTLGCVGRKLTSQRGVQVAASGTTQPSAQLGSRTFAMPTLATQLALCTQVALVHRSHAAHASQLWRRHIPSTQPQPLLQSASALHSAGPCSQTKAARSTLQFAGPKPTFTLRQPDGVGKASSLCCV